MVPGAREEYQRLNTGHQLKSRSLE